MASEPAKRTHTIAVLIVDAGLWGHCPLVHLKPVADARRNFLGFKKNFVSVCHSVTPALRDVIVWSPTILRSQ